MTPMSARSLMRSAAKLTVLGVGSVAMAAAMVSVTPATASADVVEISPRPNVSSRQAVLIDRNALRRTGQGIARGATGENRRPDSGGVMAQGIIREGIIAVPSTPSAPFGVGRDGQFRQGAPIGSW